MNPEGKTKAAQVTVSQRKKTLDRIGDSSVQFSVNVRQFVQIWTVMHHSVIRKRMEYKKAGWKESEIAMTIAKNYPMYRLDLVVQRDKIKKYLSLISDESKDRESTKTDES